LSAKSHYDCIPMSTLGGSWQAFMPVVSLPYFA
jgi:hypothetical protein